MVFSCVHAFAHCHIALDDANSVAGLCFGVLLLVSSGHCFTEGCLVNCGNEFAWLGGLDGQNRAIVIAESLARVIVAIQIASVRWSSYLPPKHRIRSS